MNILIFALLTAFLDVANLLRVPVGIALLIGVVGFCAALLPSAWGKR